MRSYLFTHSTTSNPFLRCLCFNQDVEGFLYNLFADPDIIRLPICMRWLQKPLAWFIANRRLYMSGECTTLESAILIYLCSFSYIQSPQVIDCVSKHWWRLPDCQVYQVTTTCLFCSFRLMRCMQLRTKVLFGRCVTVI